MGPGPNLMIVSKATHFLVGESGPIKAKMHVEWLTKPGSLDTKPSALSAATLSHMLLMQ